MIRKRPPVLAGRKPRRRVTVVGVIGELLITAGVLVLCFLGWQLWLNDLLFSNSQKDAATELSEGWQQQYEADPAPTPTATAEPDAPVEPVVMAEPELNQPFATLYIPSLGADYRRPIAQGTGKAVLDNAKLGIGHYTQTQLPGEIGNFVIASHRSAYGGAFHNIHQLIVGSSIYVETADGWYKYIYRSTEYVKPSGVGVLLPVPQVSGAAATERLITLTTCNPFYSSAERIITYGVFDSWYPRAGGPPPEIATIAQAGGR